MQRLLWATHWLFWLGSTNKLTKTQKQLQTVSNFSKWWKRSKHDSSTDPSSQTSREAKTSESTPQFRTQQQHFPEKQAKQRKHTYIKTAQKEPRILDGYYTGNSKNGKKGRCNHRNKKRKSRPERPRSMSFNNGFLSSEGKRFATNTAFIN